MRITDSNVLAELVKGSANLGWLARFDFVGGVQRYSTRAHPVTYSGESYTTMPYLIGIEAIQEKADTKPQGFRLTLTGFDSSLLSLALDDGADYYGRKVVLRLAMFDQDDALIGVSNPLIGLMSHTELVRGVENAIAMVCEADLSRWNQSKPIYSTNASQQRFKAGDKFFDQGPSLRDKTIYWGGFRVGTTGGGGGGRPEHYRHYAER